MKSTTTFVVHTKTQEEEIERAKKENKPIINLNIVEDATFKIISIFENLLSENNIKIPDEHRLGEEDEACIFGLTYYEVEDKVKAILQDLIVRGQL